jgi:hypothetical protein
MAVLKSTTNSKARGRNIVDEPKPAIVPIISAIRAEMKNSIVSASIFFNSIESLYKYHYKVRHYNLVFFPCMCRIANSQVLIEQEQTIFLLTAYKIRVLLRSWVQILRGPFLSAVQLRYWFEIVFDSCRTDSAAMAWTD